MVRFIDARCIKYIDYLLRNQGLVYNLSFQYIMGINKKISKSCKLIKKKYAQKKENASNLKVETIT